MKKEMMKGFLVYTSASYAVQLIGIFTSVTIRHFMEPASMGVWSLLDVMTKYGLYANLGILTAMNVELPVCVGKGDLETAAKMRNSTLAFAVMASAAFGLVAALGFGLFKPDAPQELKQFVWMNCALLVVTTWYNFYISLMWAEKKFGFLAGGIIANALLYLGLVFILVPKLGVAGLLVTAISSLVLAATLMHVGLRASLRFQLDLKILAGLIKTGLPLMAVGFAYSFFTTVDRFLIGKWLGTVQLGYYSIAILMLTYSITIPTMVSNVIFPNILEKFGKTGSRSEISGYVTKPVLLLCYVMPVILGGAYFGVPYLVKTFMPKYEPGIESMHIVLLGAFFISISQPVINYLLTIGKRLNTIPVMAAGTVSAVVCSSMLVRAGHGLAGVAVGMSVGYLVFYTVLLFYAFGYFQDWRRTFAFYAESLLCFAYLVLVVRGVGLWVRLDGPLLDCAAKVSVFLVLASPYLWLVEKKTGALSMLWSTLKGWRERRVAPAAVDA